MAALTVLFSLLFIGVILFICVVFPIWMIVDCATSASRKSLSKALWIVFMLLTWVLGGIAYGLLASRKKALQWTSGALFMVGALMIFYFLRSLFYVADLASTEALKKVEAIQAGVLTQQDLARIKDGLSALQREEQSDKGIARMFALRKSLKNITLTQIFLKMQDDGALTPSEYKIWIEKFDTRATQDPDDLKEFLDKKGWE